MVLNSIIKKNKNEMFMYNVQSRKAVRILREVMTPLIKMNFSTKSDRDMRMNRLDKIKLVTDIKYISNINHDVFIKKMRNARIASWQYKTNVPYSLCVEKNRDRNELIIEFSGKILLDDYPQLICTSTIHQCLENINNLGICQLDVEPIIEHSQVLKCDVTQDVPYENLSQLTSKIVRGIKNHQKYSYRQDGSNLTINNNVSTPNRKVRLVIYDKDEEMVMSANREFLKSTNNPERVLDYFKNKIRFEMNMNSVNQIKKRLHLNDNSLLSILNSTAQPILDFLYEIIRPCDSHPKSIVTLHDYEQYLLLSSCNYDLGKVETVVRRFGSPKVAITKKMKPYRELLRSILHNEEPDVREDLRTLLSIESKETCAADDSNH